MWLCSKQSALSQVGLIGVLGFLGPGLFNAINALGTVGSGDPTVSAAANGSLYLVFTVVGYLSSIFFFMFGPQACFTFGLSTYVFYLVCIYYAPTVGIWLAVLGGSVLGFGAGIFWTAQTTLMLVYATDHEKGRFAALFWSIFSLGSCLGGFMQMILNWESFEEDNGGLYSTSGAVAAPLAYWTFIALMILGCFLSLFGLASPALVIKSDGTTPIFPQYVSPRRVLKPALQAIKEPLVWRMAPFFFYSNWYYAFQFNALNGFFFNIRTAGLNASTYRIANIAGAQALSVISDTKRWSIQKKARIILAVNMLIFALSWILALLVMFSVCNGRVDKDLSIYDPNDQVEYSGEYTLLDTETWNPIFDANGEQVTVGNVHINRLAWFPGGQDSYFGNEMVEDGCAWLFEAKLYFRELVGELPSTDGTWPDDPAARIRCLSKRTPDGDPLCLWDIFQCVDLDSPNEYGRGMLDVVQNSKAAMCDLLQPELCVTFDANYFKADILPMLTLVLMGFSDALFQTFIFWMIGVKAQSSATLTVKYTAAFKGIQSLGGAISWLTDMIPSNLYRYQAIVNIVLGLISFIGAFFAVPILDNASYTCVDQTYSYYTYYGDREYSEMSAYTESSDDNAIIGSATRGDVGR